MATTTSPKARAEAPTKKQATSAHASTAKTAAKAIKTSTEPAKVQKVKVVTAEQKRAAGAAEKATTHRAAKPKDAVVPKNATATKSAKATTKSAVPKAAASKNGASASTVKTAAKTPVAHAKAPTAKAPTAKAPTAKPAKAPAGKPAAKEQALKETATKPSAPAKSPAKAPANKLVQGTRPAAAKPGLKTEPAKPETTKAAGAKATGKPSAAAHAAAAGAEKVAQAPQKPVSQPKSGLGLLSSRKKDPAQRRTEGYTEERFLTHQTQALHSERAVYLEQAQSLRAEAESLVEEMEPGDIQFDDESGEGGTVTVDRERDLALSAQAMATVEEIDHALAKISGHSYGICENCGRLIPKPRLEALPFARLCIDCKSGGLSRR